MSLIKYSKRTLVIICCILLQACYTYKPITINQLKVGKKYEVKVIDGRKIENKCLAITKDSVIFKARNVQLNFLKTDIESIKRIKTSPIAYIIPVAVTAAIIISITENKVEPVFDPSPND